MATEGFQGFYVETRDYKATAAFWQSLGFENVFETDHSSGQWIHPNGGPYVFINEQHDTELTTHPILHVADAAKFVKTGAFDFAREFVPEHWGVLDGALRDPDGREVSLQAPLPAGVSAPDAAAHHGEKYGTN